MVGQGLVGPHRRIERHAKPLGNLRRQRLRQRFPAVRQPVAGRHLLRQALRRFRERHEAAAQFLRQRAQVVLDLLLEVPRHRPVERGGRERLRFAHAHVERHAVVGLPGFVGVGQRQGAVVEGQRLGKRRRIVLQRLRIAQVFRRQHQEPGFGPAPFAHQINQLAHRRHRRLFEPRRVKPIRRLVEIEKPAVPRARQGVGEFLADRAVVRDEIERERDRVVHQAFADEQLQRVHRVDFPVADRLALQLQAVEARTLLRHHAAFVHVPKRFAVAHPHEVRAEIQRPDRIEPRAGARKQPRGLHDLRRNDPARRLRRRTFRRPPARAAFRRALFRLLAAEEHRAGKQRHAPVVRRLVAAVLFVEVRDVAQEAGEDAAVDGPVKRRAERRRLRVDLAHAVIRRGQPEIVPLLQRIQQLRVDVAPLAHPRVAEKMVAAKPPELRLRHRLKLPVIRLPDVEQREKIRVGMHKAPVRRVGLLLLVHRPLARILDAQARRDDDDFAHRLLRARLQNHPPHRGIHREPREFAPDRREHPHRVRDVVGGVERPEFLEQRVAGADGLRRRHVDEWKPLDVAEAEGLHAQNHVREIRPLDLRLGEPRPLQKILLRVEPDAHAVGDAAAAALALVGARLRHRLDRQTPRARRRRVAAQPRQPRVDDEPDARNRQRCLRDVRREDDFPPLRRGENALLLDVGEPAEHRDDLAVPEPAALEQIAEFADVALAREKHEHVAAGALAHDALDGLDRAVDVVQRLGLRLAFVALGGVGTELVERRVDHLHRIRAALDLDDRRVVERLAEGFRVDRRRGDHDLQLGALVAQGAQMPEEEIDVERAFVRLVDDDRVVAAQERIALHLGEQHAVGEKLDDRIAGGLVVEPDLTADLAAPLHAEFLGHAARDRERGHAAGLRARDAPQRTAPGGEAHFRNLRGFARPGFTRENDHLVRLDRGRDLLHARRDRQFGRELQAEGKGFV